MNDALRAAIVEAIPLWQQGQQPQAVERIRAFADQDEPAALGLICWFFHQMGEPGWRQGAPYAQKAVEKGLPWVSGYFIGNMQNDPGLRPQVPALLRASLEAGWPNDPVGMAMGPFQQGDTATGLAMLEVAETPYPFPHGWSAFLEEARSNFRDLAAAAGDVNAGRDEALESIRGDAEKVKKHEEAVETRTKQLVKLIEQTTNAEVQTFFDSEASTYETESRDLWKWAVRVLAGAAVVAILPILIYYVGEVLGKDPFKGENIIAAHFAPALALGAVAGVLLARSRGRDRARQRAKDLSVALATMFVYSNQIANEEERQLFLREMGRTVIESFLRQDSPAGSDGDGVSLLSALMKSK